MNTEWINFPSLVGFKDSKSEEVSINEYLELIAFVSIIQDDTWGNPLTEQDGLGMIYSFSHRHSNHIDKKIFDSLVEKFGDDIVRLSYFEHGNIIWKPQGELDSTPDFRWDGVSLAGIWVPDDCILDCAEGVISTKQENNGINYSTLSDELKAEFRKEWMTDQAREACRVYTAYCNGESYGYDIQIYKLRKADNGHIYNRLDDYRFDSPVVEESCFGYYGCDETMEQVKETIEGLKTVEV